MCACVYVRERNIARIRVRVRVCACVQGYGGYCVEICIYETTKKFFPTAVQKIFPHGSLTRTLCVKLCVSEQARDGASMLELFGYAFAATVVSSALELVQERRAEARKPKVAKVVVANRPDVMTNRPVLEDASKHAYAGSPGGQAHHEPK